jgi:drug/metabolite transporter (DMT)-like permease
VAEAGVVQPFSYFQLVFIGVLATTLFGERPDAYTIAGAGLIIAAGIYTLIRQAKVGWRS